MGNRRFTIGCGLDLGTIYYACFKSNNTAYGKLRLIVLEANATAYSVSITALCPHFIYRTLYVFSSSTVSVWAINLGNATTREICLSLDVMDGSFVCK